MVSPMQQYCAVEGIPNNWHFVHLGSRAVGGAGIIMVEATAITPEARWTTGDLGLWNEQQVEAFQRITKFIKAQGCVPAIQIGHAGARGSRRLPWDGFDHIPVDQGGWPLVSASGVAPVPRMPLPRALSIQEINVVVTDFKKAASRALAAGFEVLGIHGAHGYLIHQFLSPLVNKRKDEYGGSFDNRIRFLREIIEAIRSVWPPTHPLFLRISASDFAPLRLKAWKLEDSIALAKAVGPLGIDLITTSGGGLLGFKAPQNDPGCRLTYAERVRREGNIKTSAVGLITEAQQADQIIRIGQADLVAVAREHLRNPYFALHAAKKLGHSVPVPEPYGRAF